MDPANQHTYVVRGALFASFQGDYHHVRVQSLDTKPNSYYLIMNIKELPVMSLLFLPSCTLQRCLDFGISNVDVMIIF